MEPEIVEDKKPDDWDIVYMTLFLVGAFVFIWLLVAIFTDETIKEGEDIEN